MPSSNPVFTSTAFGGPTSNYGFGRNEDAFGRSLATTMTVQGTAIKAFGLLAIVLVTAGWAWTQVAHHQQIMPLALGAGIGGFIVAMVTTFKPAWSPITAPLYAALEGVFLGAISSILGGDGTRYQGLPQLAVVLTTGTLMLMLLIYATGLIRVTPKLAAGIMAATGAVALSYLVFMLLSLFHVEIPIARTSQLSIGFSLFVVGLAAFNLLLDFESITQGERSGAPRYMEWYGAFGLMVTLIWLYLEIFRLLRNLQDRR